MQTLVIYDSKFGNTEQIASAIGAAAGAGSSVRVLDVGSAGAALTDRPDLLLVGGPTQNRRLSPALSAYLDTLRPGALAGVAVATFDTRYRGSTLFLGSAAAEAAKRLKRAGGSLVSPSESFFIGRGEPLERQTLEAGEIARAGEWGRAVVAAALGRLA